MDEIKKAIYINKILVNSRFEELFFFQILLNFKI